LAHDVPVEFHGHAIGYYAQKEQQVADVQSARHVPALTVDDNPDRFCLLHATEISRPGLTLCFDPHYSRRRRFMPNADPVSYFPVLLQILLADATAGALVALSWLLGQRTLSPQKDAPYGCGMSPSGTARERFI